ncbi:MAG: hypothetical protein KKB51_14045 [Candidatus Riflebacteria bacterium]|nr:hypothetical protein [Candidatus Riflebacteria bacterium]
MRQRLEQKYVRLCQEHKAGQIDADTFTHEVNQLRCEDRHGNWWQISAENGKWLIWNGNNWAAPQAGQHLETESRIQSAEKGHAENPQQSHRQAAKVQTSEPAANNSFKHNGQGTIAASELPGFISFDFRGLTAQILRNTFQRGRVMLTFGVIAFLLHTFLLAVGNDGFDKNSNISRMFQHLSAYNNTIFSGQLPWYIDYTIGDFQVGSNIAIIGNKWPAVFGWLLGGALILSMWRAFRSNGILNSLRRLLSMPKQVALACTPNLGLNIVALAAGIIFARWLSDYLPQQSQNMLSFISLGLVGSIIPLALGSWLARIGMQMAGQLRQTSLKQTSYAGLSQLMFLGVSVGMFSRSVWQYGPTVGWGLALYTLYLILTKTGQPLPVNSHVASFLSFTALGGMLVLLCDQQLFAHDKGWWENVNPNDPILTQITSWVKSEGSIELMKAGVPPSIGAAIGAGAADAAVTTTTYVLQVSSYNLAVSAESPAELMVAVWKSENGGALVPAGDASISLSAQGENWMTLSQTSGVCRMNCMVGQRAEAAASTVPQPAYIYVTGIGGGQSCSATVTVAPGGGPAYVLEVF